MLFSELKMEQFAPELLCNIIPGAEMRHQVLRPGNVRVRYRCGQFGNARLMAGRYSFSACVTGVYPERVWSFGVRAGLSEALSLNRHRAVPRNVVAVWPPGCEMEYVTQSEEEWFVLEVPDEPLRNVFKEMTLRDLSLPTGGVQLREVSAPMFRAFRAELESLFAQLKLHARNEEADRFEAVLGDRITSSLAVLLCNGVPQAGRSGLSAGELLALREFSQMITDWRRDPRSPLTLDKLENVHPRLLQKAVRLMYGVTPLQWLKILRLNCAYRDLRLGVSDSVTETGQRWHFGQLGRFAGEYKALFGETPRQTLKRGTANASTGPLHHLL